MSPLTPAQLKAKVEAESKIDLYIQKINQQLLANYSEGIISAYIDYIPDWKSNLIKAAFVKAGWRAEQISFKSYSDYRDSGTTFCFKNNFRLDMFA